MTMLTGFLMDPHPAGEDRMIGPDERKLNQESNMFRFGTMLMRMLNKAMADTDVADGFRSSQQKLASKEGA